MQQNHNKILVELINKNTNHEVCQLLSNGYYEKNLKKKNVKIYNINIKRNITVIRSIFKLYRIIKTSKPHIIHCWMYHSCLIISLLKYFSLNGFKLFIIYRVLFGVIILLNL